VRGSEGRNTASIGTAPAVLRPIGLRLGACVTVFVSFSGDSFGAHRFMEERMRDSSSMPTSIAGSVRSSSPLISCSEKARLPRLCALRVPIASPYRESACRRKNGRHPWRQHEEVPVLRREIEEVPYFAESVR
jgi:hypothetical protein